jgi:O-antigen ligase
MARARSGEPGRAAGGSAVASLPSDTARARRARLLPTGLDGSTKAKLASLVGVVGLGLLAGVDPPAALMTIAGLTLVAVVVVNLTAGIMVFAVAQTLESLPDLTGGASVAQLVGVFLVVGWLAAIALGRAEERGARDVAAANPALVWLLALSAAWIAISGLWAEDPERVRFATVYYVFVALLFPVVFAGIRTARHVTVLYACLVGSALVAAVFAMQTQSVDGRLFGSGFNPNQLALYLIVAVALSVTLAADPTLSRPARLAAAAAAALCPLLIVLTGSRQALVGIVAAVLVAPFAAGRGRRLATFAALVLLVAATTLWLVAFAPASTVERLQRFDSGSGRTDLWRIGVRMFEANPVTGVGAGNFEVSSVHYLLEPGTIAHSNLVVDHPVTTHNVYLQTLSELGIVGLALFAAVILYSVACVFRAVGAARRSGDAHVEILARGLVVALAGLLAAVFFSSQVFSKEMYLLLALGPALLAIARRTPAGAGR